jgi:hypothetical protein
MIKNIPQSMTRIFKRSVPFLDPSASVSAMVETLNFIDLPKFGGDTKQLKCNAETQVGKVLKYVSDQCRFDKHIVISSSREFDPLHYVEMIIETG